jgi:hypothetical protein
MATTTPNFGWPVPTSSDLVKNGATAIEGLGDAIDASLLDLKGGTTGQVLSKASNTDMDFTWVTDAAGDITGVTAGTGISGGGTSGTVTVTNSMATAITTAGDLIKGTGAGTFDRLGIGSTGQVLTVTAGAPAWATPAGGTPTYVGVSLNNTVSQTTSNNTYTVLTFNNEVFDTDGFHDNSTNTNRITIPSGKAGKYLVTCTATFAANATGTRLMYIVKNSGTPSGSTTMMSVQVVPNSTVTPSVAGSVVLNLAVGDYINLAPYQNSGGSLDVIGNNSDGNVLNFSASYLGA